MSEKSSLKTIVLIGRTNVGKSSLFNRLTENDQALVSNIAGTTRDINRGIVEWEGNEFNIIDTGGIDLSRPDDVEKKVIDKAWELVTSADKVFLVTDAKYGIVPNDEKIAQELRERGIPFEIIANKADAPKLHENSSEFLELSPVVYPMSAVNGSGTGDFLDTLLPQLYDDLSKHHTAQREVSDEEKKEISIAFAGIPNVGKSSLVNALLGRDEVIVSDQAHTTRERRDSYLEVDGQPFRLIDTAGIRKARKMRKFLMRKSAEYSISAIKEADWVIMVLDSTEPKWGEQERYIMNEIIKSGTNIVMAANKWDLLKEDPDRFKDFERRWNRSFGSYQWIPVVPVGAKDGWHVTKLLKKVEELHENRFREIPQSALDRLLKSAIKRRRPQKKKGPEAPYIHTIKQIDTAPPTFEVVIQNQDTLAESYVRYLKKVFREKFDFEGTPIRIYVRSVRTV